jgi:hypothetical protein
MDELEAFLFLKLNPDAIFEPKTGPVANCPKVGERYRSEHDIVEVIAVQPNQRLTLKVVERWSKPGKL